MNLILLEPAEVDADGVVALSGARARHLIEVLRAAPGTLVRVGVLDGKCGTGTVVSLDRHAAVMHCVFESHVAPRPSVDLLLALPRPKVMRRLWAQLAALGVGQIILTNAARVERNYFDTHVLRPEGYRPLLIEGLQQARDTYVPLVSVHRQLKVLVEDHLDALCPAGHRLVAHPASRTPLEVPIRGAAGERVLLAVGPEGGWNEFELQLLDAHRFHAVGLGSRRLRSDTACIVLLALVQQAQGRFTPGFE